MSTSPLLSQVAAAIERFAPRHLQESYDNTGWQVLCDPAGRCSGILTCVDATPEVVAEAARLGYNLVLSHHPVMFRGQKCLAGETLVQRTVMDAIRLGVSIYSCHTAIDSAPGGISHEMARMLGLRGVKVLHPAAPGSEAGLGCIGDLPRAMLPQELAGLVKQAFDIPVARCSRPADENARISRVALCGGSGSEFIPLAASLGAQAYITSDTRHHDFVDHAREIFIIDIPHWNAESCVRAIFGRILAEAFPGVAVKGAETDRPPLQWL